MLADLSLGMLQEARQNLGGSLGEFTFVEADAQAIPFPDTSFDGVIANHMLYHVPDRETALAEIRRVLRPGGHLYAATNGQAHMREVRDWVQRWVPDTQRWSFAFSLETGQEQLERWFPSVTLHRYEDTLVVTEAEPLIAYVRSGYAGSAVSGDPLTELTAFVRQELAAHGAIRITKDTGLFEAWGGEGGG
jgi:SAM-dependent methyltransferase